MGIFGIIKKLFDPFGAWMDNATHQELADEYEKRRLVWINTQESDITPKMKRLNDEMRKRSAEEWENNPHRSKDPNFRWTDANRWDRD